MNRCLIVDEDPPVPNPVRRLHTVIPCDSGGRGCPLSQGRPSGGAR